MSKDWYKEQSLSSLYQKNPLAAVSESCQLYTLSLSDPMQLLTQYSVCQNMHRVGKTRAVFLLMLTDHTFLR